MIYYLFVSIVSIISHDYQYRLLLIIIQTIDFPIPLLLFFLFVLAKLPIQISPYGTVVIHISQDSESTSCPNTVVIGHLTPHTSNHIAHTEGNHFNTIVGFTLDP